MYPKSDKRVIDWVNKYALAPVFVELYRMDFCNYIDFVDLKLEDEIVWKNIPAQFEATIHRFLKFRDELQEKLSNNPSQNNNAKKRKNNDVGESSQPNVPTKKPRSCSNCHMPYSAMECRVQINSMQTIYVCPKCTGFATCKNAHFHAEEARIERKQISSDKKKRKAESRQREKELQALLTPKITKTSVKASLVEDWRNYLTPLLETDPWNLSTGDNSHIILIFRICNFTNFCVSTRIEDEINCRREFMTTKKNNGDLEDVLRALKEKCSGFNERLLIRLTDLLNTNGFLCTWTVKEWMQKIEVFIQDVFKNGFCHLAPTQAGNAPTQTVNTPIQTETSLTQTVNTPTQAGNAPTQTVNTPTQTENVPIQTVNTPTQSVNTPTQTENAPTQTVNTPTQTVNTPTQPRNVSTQNGIRQAIVINGSNGPVIIQGSFVIINLSNIHHTFDTNQSPSIG